MVVLNPVRAIRYPSLRAQICGVFTIASMGQMLLNVKESHAQTTIILNFNRETGFRRVKKTSSSLRSSIGAERDR